MTEQEQRIAIAEACGWEFRPECGPLDLPWWHRPTKQRASFESLPNYLNDLNAMFAAEEVLKNHKGTFHFHHGKGSTSNIWAGYRSELNELLGGSWTCAREAEIFHATAAQRAEAFLKCLGKWND